MDKGVSEQIKDKCENDSTLDNAKRNASQAFSCHFANSHCATFHFTEFENISLFSSQKSERSRMT